MGFLDRLRVGSIFVEPRNLPARLNPSSLIPKQGQSFKNWVGGVDIATQATGHRSPDNFSLADRTEYQRILRVKSPMFGYRIRSRRLNRQQLRSRRLR